MTRNRVRGDVGRHSRHGSRLRPYVMLEIDEEWLTPSEARRMAERLILEAKRAEDKHEGLSGKIQLEDGQ